MEVTYVRESTEEQDKGFSPDNQERTIREYAKRNKITIDKVYKDLISGKTVSKRTDFQRMIEDAMQKKFPLVTPVGIFCFWIFFCYCVSMNIKIIEEKISLKPKMSYIHKELAAGGWAKLSFAEQMANIGSEVERTINWREKNQQYSQQAFERALELVDLSVADKKSRRGGRLKELLRMREALVDYFLFDNVYASSDVLWQKYFSVFYFLVANRKKL